ncbi:threonine synthase [Clostridium sp. LBM24168]
MEKICYNSTRGLKQDSSASWAILNGIAKDGGLFVPDQIPFIGNKLERCIHMGYKELALFIISKFFTDIDKKELSDCIDKAYDNKFECDEIVPLKKTEEAFYLELYHGPTLAFKDMALCLLPYLMKVSAEKQNLNKEIVILTATSGDTGKAALHGFADVDGTKIIVFFPKDGVSEIQKMQMITQKGKNTKVIGIDGNFDDAQSEVKKIFNENELKNKLEENGYVFSSANSINIGRLIPQVVYYFYGYMELVREGEIKFGDKINFDVPTGNFGNILAAYYAKKMGLPINKLICASNDNKVLFDFLSTGTYDKVRDFIVTISPSMDILVSSNLERLLYDISSKDTDLVMRLMGNLNKKGKYTITDNMRDELKSFYGGFASEKDTMSSIRYNFQNYNYLMDTHTAVAHSVYEKYVNNTGDKTKTIIVSTASPYKFTKSVMTALNEKYGSYNDMELIDIMSKVSGLKVPDALQALKKDSIIHRSVCKKQEMKNEIIKFLLYNN